jgi:uncharacterized glyoxalase superfamily protein PhnB
VVAAADWLCSAFGFTIRLRIASHRIQMKFGDGCLIIAEAKRRSVESGSSQFVMVRVMDANEHHARALQHGAKILAPPTDHPYGERQYKAEDPFGHQWTFTQTIADVDPLDWGGTPVNPD